MQKLILDGEFARCVQGKQDAAGRALVGLLVHSAADGFAVGASSVSSSASLPFLVAVAMVLHKARRGAQLPAVFLGTLMLHKLH